eukprot:Rmarinus@m.16590
MTTRLCRHATRSLLVVLVRTLKAKHAGLVALAIILRRLRGRVSLPPLEDRIRAASVVIAPPHVKTTNANTTTNATITTITDTTGHEEFEKFTPQDNTRYGPTSPPLPQPSPPVTDTHRSRGSR